MLLFLSLLNGSNDSSPLFLASLPDHIRSLRLQFVSLLVSNYIEPTVFACPLPILCVFIVVIRSRLFGPTSLPPLTVSFIRFSQLQLIRFSNFAAGHQF